MPIQPMGLGIFTYMNGWILWFSWTGKYTIPIDPRKWGSHEFFLLIKTMKPWVVVFFFCLTNRISNHQVSSSFTAWELANLWLFASQNRWVCLPLSNYIHLNLKSPSFNKRNLKNLRIKKLPCLPTHSEAPKKHIKNPLIKHPNNRSLSHNG